MKAFDADTSSASESLPELKAGAPVASSSYGRKGNFTLDHQESSYSSNESDTELRAEEEPGKVEAGSLTPIFDIKVEKSKLGSPVIGKACCAFRSPRERWSMVCCLASIFVSSMASPWVSLCGTVMLPICTFWGSCRLPACCGIPFELCCGTYCFAPCRAMGCSETIFPCFMPFDAPLKETDFSSDELEQATAMGAPRVKVYGFSAKDRAKGELGHVKDLKDFVGPLIKQVKSAVKETVTAVKNSLKSTKGALMNCKKKSKELKSQLKQHFSKEEDEDAESADVDDGQTDVDGESSDRGIVTSTAGATPQADASAESLSTEPTTPNVPPPVIEPPPPPPKATEEQVRAPPQVTDINTTPTPAKEETEAA